LSNESPTLVEAYFDDVSMTHTPSNILQYNEYYPFNMNTANSWTRENTTGNNFLGNGGTELNPTSQLYDLDYRNYDPILGRMHQVDPMATKYASLTPYNYSFNDPVTFSDVNGADPYSGYVEGFDPILENYFGRIYNNSYGWLTDDVVYQRIIGYRAPTARYGGTLALPQNQRDMEWATGGSLGKGWKPGQGSLINQNRAAAIFGPLVYAPWDNAYYSAFDVALWDPTNQRASYREAAFDAINNWGSSPQQQQAQGPGSLFNSIDAAAIDWGMRYNDNSIASGDEYGSSIYRIGNSYSYSKPRVGNKNEVTVSPSPKAYKTVAFVHSHGAYRSEYKGNELLGHDVDQANANNLIVFASTPNGMLLRYDPGINVRDNWVNTFLPSDPNDPFRQNSVNPYGLLKNEPTWGLSDWWNHLWE
jgi:RHS repeat-associated protein